MAHSRYGRGSLNCRALRTTTTLQLVERMLRKEDYLLLGRREPSTDLVFPDWDLRMSKRDEFFDIGVRLKRRMPYHVFSIAYGTRFADAVPAGSLPLDRLIAVYDFIDGAEESPSSEDSLPTLTIVAELPQSRFATPQQTAKTICDYLRNEYEWYAKIGIASRG